MISVYPVSSIQDPASFHSCCCNRLSMGPLLTCQNHRGFNLTLRDIPEPVQEHGLFLRAREPISIPAIKIDGPDCVGPCSDKNGFFSLRLKELKKLPADAFSLLVGFHIGMPDQMDFSFVLDTHHSQQSALILKSKSGVSLPMEQVVISTKGKILKRVKG